MSVMENETAPASPAGAASEKSLTKDQENNHSLQGTAPEINVNRISEFTESSLAELAKSGIPVERAVDFGVSPVRHPDDVPAEINRRWVQGPGMLFQWRDRDRTVVQFRPDVPVKDADGEECKYIFPAGVGPFLCHHREAKDDNPVLFVEGAKQGISAAIWAPEGWGVVAVPGCNNWLGTDLTWAEGRDVVCLFDADVVTNLNVWNAASELKEALELEGAESVKFAKLAGAQKKDGIDDVLGRRPEDKRTPYLKSLAKAAALTPGKRPRASKRAPAVREEGAALLPSPSEPMKVAREITADLTHNGSPTLRKWRDSWMTWDGAFWSEKSAEDVEAMAWNRTEHATFIGVDKEGEEQELSWTPNRSKIGDLMAATGAVLHTPSYVELGSWLSGQGGGQGGGQGSLAVNPQVVRGGQGGQGVNGNSIHVETLIPFRNGLLNLATRELTPPTAEYFNGYALPFDYNPSAPKPVEWLKFLASVWQDDEQAVTALQQWFGYVISGRTDLHKILFLQGPTRSGKGTIGRILRAILGESNTAGPTLAALASQFGLQGLIGKPLALIADARKPRSDAVSTVIERLLGISGGDSISVDRKNRTAWDGQLPCRFMILSNDAPNLPDPSGAISSRLLILTMETSFLNNEDHELEGRLRKELDGILNWALEGLDSLTRAGRFVQPDSSALTAEVVADTASPIKKFLAECCTLDREKSVPKTDLYAAWVTWCEKEKRHPGSPENLGQQILSAGVPGMRNTRLRVGETRIQSYAGVELRVKTDFPLTTLTTPRPPAVSHSGTPDHHPDHPDHPALIGHAAVESSNDPWANKALVDQSFDFYKD